MKNLKKYLIRRLLNDEGGVSVWGKAIINAYSCIARLPFLVEFSYAKEKDILILGSKIYNSVDDPLRDRSHLVMTARDLYRTRQFPKSFTYDLKTYKAISLVIERDDFGMLLLRQKKIEKILSLVSPKIIIANSTIDPINRLWIKCAKSMGINVLCVQHGVYNNTTPDYALEEDIVDRYLCLDYNQYLIVKRNIPSEKIVILGAESSFVWIPPKDGFRVCFVGEDWERYGMIDEKKIIIDTYIRIISSMKLVDNISFFYKPHPNESNMMNIKNFAKKIGKDKINQMDVFVGFTSTLLKEMSSARKLAIQIIDARIPSINFERQGYCKTIAVDISELGNEISNLIQENGVVPCIDERNVLNMELINNLKLAGL